MRQFSAVVALNYPVAPDWMHLAFEWPKQTERLPVDQPKPGQFFTVLPPFVETTAGALLRRPLAFAGFTSDGAVELAHALYQVRGPMTRALSLMKPGMSLDVIGPLGTCFPLPHADRHAVIAGGGIGTGPVLFLAESLQKQGFDTRLALGFRSASRMPLTGTYESAGLPIWNSLIRKAVIATDDGSAGIRGTIVDVLRHLQQSSDISRWHLYACGPAPMLAALSVFAEQAAIPAHFSAEQWMACGVGACHGCVIPTKANTYLRVCTDGPVFDARIIDWESDRR